jgi:hypothetical protein
MSEQSIPESLLSKVRALLAKAEDPAATTAEAEAFTAKATELMAKYGIEQALIADHNPDAGKPGNRILTMTAPWAMEKARLAYFLSETVGCKAVRLEKKGDTERVHIFGFGADLERAELLYTSLLLQMTSGLGRVRPPVWESPRAFRRSWLLGFRTEVVERVRAAEKRAAAEAAPAPGRSTELVLADRAALVSEALTAEYPEIRQSRSRYSGSGYRDGKAAGSRANIGQVGLAGGRRAIGGVR